MSDRRVVNDGFRLIPEFVCQAIPDGALAESHAQVGSPATGSNQGVRLLDEFVLAAGPPETFDETRRRKESVPRFLIRAIFRARAVELATDLPVTLDQLDFCADARETTTRVIFRYLFARELHLARPSEVRSTFCVDLAVLMTELARPGCVFVAEARRTAMEVACGLLRLNGWESHGSAFSEWKERTLAVDPTGPNTAREYLDLLPRYWGWVGVSSGNGVNEHDLACAVSIPDAVLADMTRRCTGTAEDV